MNNELPGPGRIKTFKKKAIVLKGLLGSLVVVILRAFAEGFGEEFTKTVASHPIASQVFKNFSEAMPKNLQETVTSRDKTAKRPEINSAAAKAGRFTASASDNARAMVANATQSNRNLLNEALQTSPGSLPDVHGDWSGEIQLINGEIRPIQLTLSGSGKFYSGSVTRPSLIQNARGIASFSINGRNSGNQLEVMDTSATTSQQSVMEPETRMILHFDSRSGSLRGTIFFSDANYKEHQLGVNLKPVK